MGDLRLRAQAGTLRLVPRADDRRRAALDTVRAAQAGGSQARVSAIAFDPLIAEAKERARRRRLLALGLVVAAAAIAATFALRSPAPVNSLGVCASVPSGWQERTVTDPSLGPPAVVLTNFRFGKMDDFYGLTDRFAWPENGVTVAVSNEDPASGFAAKRGALRFTAAYFGGIEGSAQP